MDDNQKLIDIMFQVALMIHNSPSFTGKDNEFICAWVRRQLELCGFKTEPCGSSWGILKNE